MIRWVAKHALYVAALGFGGVVAWAVVRPAVVGSGNSVTEERGIGSASEVYLSGVGDVTIVRGDTPSVRVTADDNVLPFLSTEAKGRKLYIGPPSSVRVRPNTKITYVVTVPQLEAVTVSGAGNVTVDRLIGDDLKVKLSGAGIATLNDVTYRELALDLSGAGKATVTGGAVRTTLKLSGAGKIDASGLRTDYADVQVSGAGQATVWATLDLKAKVSGAGHIRYKGNSPAMPQVSGAGSISALD